MTGCFTDHSHFVVISGMIIATVAYLTPCASNKSWWFVALIGALASQMEYALLAWWRPDAFGYDLGTAAGTMIGLFCVFIFLVCLGVQAAVLGAALVLVGPFLIHNVMLLTDWLRAHVSDAIPTWLGAVVFVVVVVVVGVVVYKSRVVELASIVLFVVLGSTVLWVYIRMVIIESDGSEDICCEWSAEDETIDHSRCPLGLENWRYNLILVGLLVFAAYLTTTFHTRKLRQRRKTYKRLRAEAKAPGNDKDHVEVVATA